MAQKVQVLLLDDLDGSEAAQTVRFGLDGAAYEIDLSDSNADSLRESLAAYVANARKISRSAAAQPARASNGRASSARAARGAARVDREQTQAIRDWARKNGHSVSDRGRIPSSVITSYHAAH
ncbi:MAG: Lsr2 family protein [Frankiaceae bacterium]|jgi:hypothetical protein|nr:Lsr2 family protein [Frankiaceae bacterium]